MTPLLRPGRPAIAPVSRLLDSWTPDPARRRDDAAKVVAISIDVRFEPLRVEEHYREVLLVVKAGKSVLGEVYMPALPVIPSELQAEAVAWTVGERLWRSELKEKFLEAACLPATDPPAERLSVAAVVCTRDRPDQLERCLNSILDLERRPDEIVVVDNCPRDDRTRRLVFGMDMTYLREEHPGASRARNRAILESRSDLIAFTDDDCTVDPHWLDDLDASFADPMVMAVTGYIGPAEMETRAQYLYEVHGGFEKHFERTVFDGTRVSPSAAAGPAGASANVIFRRRAFYEAGLFAEDLGPGTPARSAEDAYQNYKVLAAGFRIVFEPSRIVWHRHRRDLDGLGSILRDYTISGFAYTTRCLLRHRDVGVLRVWTWWIGHFRRDLTRWLRGSDHALPLRLVLGEMSGACLGPWRLYRSRHSRKGIPPLELPSRTDRKPRSIAVGAEAPTVSVVLPSRNRRVKLAMVLEGLRRQDYPDERVEAVVILDGSDDDSGDHVRSTEMPFALRLIEQENRGLAATRNRGAHESSGDVVVFLDDDTVPEPGFLAAHAAAHASSPDDHLVLGYYPAVPSTDTLWAQVLRTWWEDHFRRKRESGHVWTYVDFAGGNASFTRRLFVETEGFDEEFRGRREDWEYAVRLLARGIRFAYHPEAVSYHHFDTSLATGLRHERQHARDDVLLGLKHPSVRAQLPLAAVADRRPAGTESFEANGILRARLYETAGLRPRWRSLVHALLTNAYALGLADALPSEEAYLAFVGPIWADGVRHTRVDLTASQLFAQPSGSGSLELEVAYRDVFGSFVPIDPGAQWEWAEVADRMTESLSSPARRAALLDATEMSRAH